MWESVHSQFKALDYKGTDDLCSIPDFREQQKATESILGLLPFHVLICRSSLIQKDTGYCRRNDFWWQESPILPHDLSCEAEVSYTHKQRGQAGPRPAYQEPY